MRLTQQPVQVFNTRGINVYFSKPAGVCIRVVLLEELGIYLYICVCIRMCDVCVYDCRDSELTLKSTGAPG